MKQEIWIQSVRKKAILVAAILGIGFLGCCFAAWLCCREVINLNGAGVLSKGIGMAGLFVGCYAAARSSMKRRLLIALGEATAVLAILMLAKAMLFPGEELAAGGMFLVGETMAAVAGLLASKEKRRKRK